MEEIKDIISMLLAYNGAVWIPIFIMKGWLLV